MIKKLWNSSTFMTWGNLSAKSSNLVILLPVVLNTFSKEDIVVWYLYFTIVSLQLLIDFGFMPTFTRLFSYAYSGLSIEEIQDIKNNQSADGEINWNSLNQLFVAIQKIYLNLSITSFFIALTLGSLFVYEPISKSSNVLESWIGWIVVVSIASFSLYANSYVALLQGMNKIAVVQRWQMFTSLLAVITATAMILLFKSLIIGIVTFYIWYLLNFIINFYLAKQYFLVKNLQIDNELIKNLVQKTIWPTAWRSGLGVVMSMGIIQFSGMLVAKIETSAVAASYMMALQIIRAISSFSQAPFYSKLPYFTQLYAKKDIVLLLSAAKNRMQKSFFVFISFYILIGFFADYLLTFIDSNIAFVNINIWIFIGAAFLLERFGAMHLQLYTLTNDIVWHIANGVTGLLMIIFTILLYKYFGIESFPIAMLLAYSIFYVPFVVKKSYKEFNIGIINFELKVFIPMFIIFSACSALMELM